VGRSVRPKAKAKDSQPRVFTSMADLKKFAVAEYQRGNLQACACCLLQRKASAPAVGGPSCGR
jgi:hypothetical protein